METHGYEVRTCQCRETVYRLPMRDGNAFVAMQQWQRRMVYRLPMRDGNWVWEAAGDHPLTFIDYL